MAINQNWKLGRRGTSCFHSGEPFADGDAIVTTVLPMEDSEEFERRDYSAESWEEARATVEPFSFWRTKFEVTAPKEKDEGVVEKETAETLLRRLIEEDDPKTENARYVLAVMLERKRTLKEVERKDTENGSRLLIYEHPKTGDVLIVRDPMLHLDEVESVQQEVSALLAPKPVAESEEGGEESGEEASSGPQASDAEAEHEAGGEDGDGAQAALAVAEDGEDSPSDA